jgi:hypothetical protein
MTGSSGAIQYSEASVIEANIRGVLEAPAFAGHDGSLWSSIRTHRGTTVSIFARSRSLAGSPITAYL